MGRVAPIITDFSAGELSPKMDGRVDTELYYRGASELENVIIMGQGGVTRRPGTYYVDDASGDVGKFGTDPGDGENHVRLYPLNISNTRKYILAFTDEEIWFYRINKITGAREVMLDDDGLTRLSVATPYKGSEVYLLKFAAVMNYLYIVSPKATIRYLYRPDDVSFDESDITSDQISYTDHGYTTGDAVVFEQGSASMTGLTDGTTYYVIRIDDDTIELATSSANATAGTNISPLGGGSTTGHILNNDFLWSLNTFSIDIPSWESGVVPVTKASLARGRSSRRARDGKFYPAGSIVEYSGNYYRAFQDTYGKYAPTDTSYWTQLTGTDPNPFDSAGNYPGAIAFHEDRLIVAGMEKIPQLVRGSAIGGYQMFLTAATDADAFEFLINAEVSNSVQWIVAGRDLIIGTIGGEWVMSGGDIGITPSNVRVNRQTNFGSNYIQARLIAESVLFIQKDGKRLREYYYLNEYDAYRSQDLTVWADHIIRIGAKEMDYTQDPDPIIWIVRTDGELALCTYEKTSNVRGWTRLVTDGEFESVAVLPGDTEDDVWVSVVRDIDGTSYRFIEYFSTRNFDEKEDAYFVDCGITQEEGDALTITGITNASPPVVTAASHGLSTDDYVKITGVTGMEADILDYDGSTAYSAGDLVSYDGATYKCTSASTGNLPTDTDYFTLYVGVLTTQGKVFKITSIDTDTFSLQDTDFRGFTAYTSGGEALPVTKTVTGLDHLDGESCAVCADGATHADKTPDSGSITLDRYANKIHVGLGYDSVIKTMRIEAGGNFGTGQGKLKRIHKASIRFYRTLAAKVGRDADNLELVTFRKASDPLGSSPALYTGDKTVNFPGTNDKDGYIYIKQDLPLPMTILAIMPELEVNG